MNSETAFSLGRGIVEDDFAEIGSVSVEDVFAKEHKSYFYHINDV